MPDSPAKRGEQNREREDVEVPCPHCEEPIKRSEFRKLVKEAKKEDDDEPTTWAEVIVKILLGCVVVGAVYYGRPAADGYVTDFVVGDAVLRVRRGRRPLYPPQLILRTFLGTRRLDRLRVQQK